MLTIEITVEKERRTELMKLIVMKKKKDELFNKSC